jgi:hypothetical protein
MSIAFINSLIEVEKAGIVQCIRFLSLYPELKLNNNFMNVLARRRRKLVSLLADKKQFLANA